MKKPIFNTPPQAGTSTPITNVSFDKLMNLQYDPKVLDQAVQIHGVTAPGVGVAKKNPIVGVYAMHDLVVYEFKQPRKGFKRWPVQYMDALRRMNAVMESLFREDGGKLQDELEYEKWLQEWTIKACARCAENIGKPFTNKAVEMKLKQLDIAVAMSRNRGAHTDDKL